MAHIIDELIVTLGLDPKNFTKGRKDAAAAMQGTRDDVDKTAKGVESAAGRMGQSVSEVQGRLLRLAGFFLGGMGLKALSEHITKVGIETGRSAQIAGTSIESMSKWQGMAARAGGSAEGMAASMAGLRQELEKFKISPDSSSITQYLNALKVSVTDVNGKALKTEEIMARIAEALHRVAKEEGAPTAFAYGRGFGFDDATIALLIKGRKELERLAREQEKIGGLSKEDADAAHALNEAWKGAEQAAMSLATKIQTWLTPALTGTLGVIKDILEGLKALPKALRWMDKKETRDAAQRQGQQQHAESRERFGKPTGIMKDISDWMILGKEMDYSREWLGMGASGDKFKEWQAKNRDRIDAMSAPPPPAPPPPPAARGSALVPGGPTVAPAAPADNRLNRRDPFTRKELPSRDDTTKMQGLRPDFKASLEKQIKDVPPEYGKVSITDGFRTYEEQADLYRRKPGLAAPPGRSQHGKMTPEGQPAAAASDLKFETEKGRKWMHDNADKYGNSFPIRKESWHIEPGKTPEAATARAAAAAALAAEAAAKAAAERKAAPAEARPPQQQPPAGPRPLVPPIVAARRPEVPAEAKPKPTVPEARPLVPPRPAAAAPAAAPAATAGPQEPRQLARPQVATEAKPPVAAARPPVDRPAPQERRPLGGPRPAPEARAAPPERPSPTIGQLMGATGAVRGSPSPLPPAGAFVSAAGAVDNSRTTSIDRSVEVGSVVIHSQAKDAAGIAREIRPELERNLTMQQADGGPN